MAVAPWIVRDGLWRRFEPLLPKRERRFRYPGRKRLDDRAALQGILFVLHTGIAWRHLPPELGFGSGSTCYRRIYRLSLASVPARRATGVCASGKRPGCGRSCTRSCSPSCTPPVRSSGRGPSPTPVTCRRKRGLRNGPEPG